MDYSITQLIVVPSSNTLPSSGYPYELSVGQVGIFKSDGTAASAGNVASEPYIYIAQGREKNDLPSDKSAKIAKAKLISYSKVTGHGTAANEIWEVGDIHVKCGEDIALTINAHSYYLDNAFYNGLTKSVVIKAPCCECDDDPCDEVDAEAIVDLFIEKLNEDFNIDRQTLNLKKFFDFEKIGSGSGAKLRISGKALDAEGQECDLALNPHMYDRLWFRPFITKAPDTTADFFVYDKCDQVGTTTLIQRSNFPILTSEEVKSLEKRYYGEKVPAFKQLYRFPGYNPYFKSYAEDGVIYNQLLIKYYYMNDEFTDFQDSERQNAQVLLLVPNTVSTVEAVLTAYFGSPVDRSGANVTTTTTTSTTTTSTTSTTVLDIP